LNSGIETMTGCDFSMPLNERQAISRRMEGIGSAAALIETMAR
jgi:hypothetical protein